MITRELAERGDEHRAEHAERHAEHAAGEAEHRRLDAGTAGGSTRGRAPSALRTPISRMRSVTDTSMMFITPMPPTSSAITAMPAEHDGQRVVDRGRRGEDRLLGRDREVGVGRGS